jgi:hypothetical protein
MAYVSHHQYISKLITEVTAQFDYQKVHKVMTELNWTWYYSQTETKVPSVGELVIRSLKLMNEAVNKLGYSEGRMIVATGGFKATAIRHDDGFITIDLEFVLTDWSAGYI